MFDPRIKHFSCYGNVTLEDCETIYPKSKLILENDEIIKEIQVNGKVGFTIYNVDNTEKMNLIKEHGKQFKLEKQSNLNIVY